MPHTEALLSHPPAHPSVTPRSQPSPEAPSVSRGRWLRRGLIAASLLFAIVTAAAGWAYHSASRVTEAHIPLYTNGIHVQPDGSLAAIEAHEDVVYLHGSRVLARHSNDPGAQEVAEQHRVWLAEADLPGTGTPYEQLVADALLDIHVLTGATFVAEDGTVTPSASGAVVAAWSQQWRYVWPRDAAFVAAALATVGHTGDAIDVLSFVQDVTTGDDAQTEDNGFHARYLPDGTGVPDDRGIQLDGNGWMLWATGMVLDSIDDPTHAADAFTRLRPLIDTAARNILTLTNDPPHLPPPSPDYWEVQESSLTLGTVAPMLAGLEHAARTYAQHGQDHDLAQATSRRAEQLREAIIEQFGAVGYERYADNNILRRTFAARDGRDAATAMLLPPFTTQAPPGAKDAWLTSIDEMARPAGGLAPGAGWRNDGVTWMPQTTLYALTAATNGYPDQARQTLDWINAHRTTSGAIPEKILADGSPAAVAPLTWSAANVILAVAALEDSASPS